MAFTTDTAHKALTLQSSTVADSGAVSLPYTPPLPMSPSGMWMCDRHNDAPR